MENVRVLIFTPLGLSRNFILQLLSQRLVYSRVLEFVGILYFLYWHVVLD